MRRVVLAAAAAALLAAPAGASAHTPTGARGGEPLARAADVDTMIALRSRYLGRGNVDQRTGAVRRDRVILSWVGVSNFVMAIRGHVVLLDAWVPRGAHSGYVPATPADLAGLRPQRIFIGHAHFDHAADAVPIAQASGATIVGSAEQCAELRSRATPPVPCLEGLPAGAAPGTTRTVDAGLAGVGVQILKHVHSGPKAPDADHTGYHLPVLPAPSTTVLEHPPTPQDLAHLVEHAPDAEAGTVLYRFAAGDLSLVWHDSAGPLLEDAPEALGALERLRPVDVQVGAIQGFNQITNGLRDPRAYIEALRPGLFVPAHHDDWAAGITTKGAAYRAPLDAELAKIPAAHRPPVRFLSDPADYVRPDVLTFPVKLDEPRLTRRCMGRGRLRVALAGETADVRGAELRLGRVRAALPITLSRKATTAAVRRRAKLSAAVTMSDGEVLTLRRTLPSCGLRR
jgi:hypothetical protein